VFLATAVVVLAFVLVLLAVATVCLAFLHAAGARATLTVAALVGDAASLPFDRNRRALVLLASLMSLSTHDVSPSGALHIQGMRRFSLVARAAIPMQGGAEKTRWGIWPAAVRFTS
jgi:hypothetical protein